MGVHMFPILKPPPTSLPVPSLWVIPVHQPQASCLKALCLLNLIPWIYLSPPLYNHKGFVFVHSPSHVRLFVTPWTTASQASLPNTIFLSEWVIVNQSCPTLCDPMRCSLPGSFVHEILQAGILEWVAISFSRLSPWVCSNLCPLNQWCHPTVSSSVACFSSCPQFPSIRVFSSESALRIRWPKYWSFSIGHTWMV